VAAYHSAILGNQDVFRDKVVMDIGTGSGILSVWAAQAGARKVYAIEYTDMAKHAEKVMKANGVDHIVTVLQTAVEDVKLPIESDQLVVEEDGTERCVDIIISEWYVCCDYKFRKTFIFLIRLIHFTPIGWGICCCVKV
jgi:protein arginine N-methyltransferase 1